MLEIKNLIHNLGQCYPIELSKIMKILYICAFQYDRQQRHVALEQVKYN